MDRSQGNRARIASEVLASSLLLAMLAGAGAMGADDPEARDVMADVEASSDGSSGPLPGVMDPARQAQLLEAHRGVEYRADIRSGTPLDPAVQAGWLEEHRRLEYPSDLGLGLLPAPAQQAAWIERHRAIEYPGDVSDS